MINNLKNKIKEGVLRKMWLLKIIGLYSESLYSPCERKIMKQYKHGKKINEETDGAIIDKYARIGFVELGYGTARLTQLGRAAL